MFWQILQRFGHLTLQNWKIDVVLKNASNVWKRRQRRRRNRRLKERKGDRIRWERRLKGKKVERRRIRREGEEGLKGGSKSKRVRERVFTGRKVVKRNGEEWKAYSRGGKRNFREG